MCGIVGYIGVAEAPAVLMAGLARLEYRGYDSAGIAVHDGTEIHICKEQGRLSNLEQALAGHPLFGTLGIGHTRWATHGVPSQRNAHPQFSQDHLIAVVHNGIIENYLEIKEGLLAQGYTFQSETDTEVVTLLIDAEYKARGDLLQAVLAAERQLRGAYALAVLCRDTPDRMIAVRKNCPLVIGLGRGENLIASDIPALLEHTRDVIFMEDREVALLTRQTVELYNEAGERIHRAPFHVTWDLAAAEKGGYEHFMIKEIHEQPEILRQVLSQRLTRTGVQMNDVGLTDEALAAIDRIQIVACGSAYYAGLIGKYLLERLARIPVVAEVASEFRYKDPLVDERTLVIVVSQSGETADTLEAMRIAKQKGARVLAVVNAVGSSIAREADNVFYILAGPEISVCSTKAYTAQVAAMELIACHFALKRGQMTQEEFRDIREGMYRLPEQVETVLEQAEAIQKLAQKYQNVKNVFFIGRGLDYLVAQEGALKLKEIAYLHSEAYAAGEMKHGPIALIENTTLVVALATQKSLLEKTLSNIQELQARGARVLAVTEAGEERLCREVEDVVTVPEAHPILMPVLTAVPAQLFAYYMALALGRDIDKPRNLAKSVTVE